MHSRRLASVRRFVAAFRLRLIFSHGRIAQSIRLRRTVGAPSNSRAGHALDTTPGPLSGSKPPCAQCVSAGSPQTTPAIARQLGNYSTLRLDLRAFKPSHWRRRTFSGATCIVISSQLGIPLTRARTRATSVPAATSLVSSASAVAAAHWQPRVPWRDCRGIHGETLSNIVEHDTVCDDEPVPHFRNTDAATGTALQFGRTEGRAYPMQYPVP